METEKIEMRLPSGAALEITLAPFADAKALAQAVLIELRKIEIREDVDHWALIKDLVCTGLSSKEIESAMNKCLARCTYNGIRIGADTWEPVSARADYVPAIYRVIEENITPFLSGLLPEFSQAKQMVLTILATQKSKSTTNQSQSI
jgi:hypothetical protein